MGPGVVLFDADGDGDMDLFVPGGTSFEGQPTQTEARSAFFENTGPFEFRDITASAGLELRGVYAIGGAAADFDGDSHTDLLVTTWGGVRLLRNLGSHKFEDVTETAGLTRAPWTDRSGHQGPDWATSALWFDGDRDGHLDLFVCNYAKWCPKNDVFDTIDGKTKSYAIPRKYEGNTCRLYRNRGDATFEDVTEKSGIELQSAKALGVTMWDINGDGFQDLVVANDAQPNFLYLSKGPLQYEEAGLKANIAYDEDARVRAGMGIAAADDRNNGGLSIPIGNFSGEPVALYRQEGMVRFRDMTQQAGIAGPTQSALTFGLVWIDVDRDGWQDLILANGHLEPDVQRVQETITYAQPMSFLRNLGGTYEDYAPFAGPAFKTPLVARGMAMADLDGDGDLDLVVGTNGGPVRFFRNDAPASSGLRVQLVGRAPNRAAIGAMVEVIAGGHKQRRLVHTGSSYASQSELTLTFGLAGADAAERVKVTWPDGTIEVLLDVAANQTLLVQQR
jgi:hypothetical protein